MVGAWGGGRVGGSRLQGLPGCHHAADAEALPEGHVQHERGAHRRLLPRPAGEAQTGQPCAVWTHIL